jgi:hypothetical protein
MCGKIFNVAAAREPILIFLQGLIPLNKGIRVVQDKGVDPATLAIADVRIVLPNHMKNHVIVSRIDMMSMPVPVRGMLVHFHISCPGQLSQTDPGTEEIGTCVEILFTRVKNPEFLSTGSEQVGSPGKPVLPDKLNNILTGHHLFMR